MNFTKAKTVGFMFCKSMFSKGVYYIYPLLQNWKTYLLQTFTTGKSDVSPVLQRCIFAKHSKLKNIPA